MQGVTEYSGMVVLFHLWKATVKHQESVFSYKSGSIMFNLRPSVDHADYKIDATCTVHYWRL